MSTSDDNQHHSQASWYPPDASSHQGQTHSKHHYYQHMNGNRPTSHSQYPPHHQSHMHAHHSAPYGHQEHPYHYPHGPDDHMVDSSQSGMQNHRRDSFPYYHHYQPQQATPIQPPPNAYNGPPVSALVPRFPRGPSHMYNQNGYTPHAIHYDSNRNSGGSYPPSSGGHIESSAHSREGMNSKDRRTSFGLPIISMNSNFLIPTPQHPSSVDMNDANSEGSSVVIPAPPSNRNNDQPHNDALRTSPSETEYSMQESRCVNLLSKKFEPSNPKIWVSSLPRIDMVDGVPKKAPTVQDASLLLGLSSDTSNNNSPATVPTLQDESDIVEKTQSEENLPKTCFPVPVPKVYPKRLALPNDTVKLNALHCFIRADLLEIFVVEPSPETLKFRHAPSSSVGRVGFRCVHCAMIRTNAMNSARDDEAPMSVFYPKTVSEIYRLVTSWQRCHVRKCKNLPKDVREKWYSLRETEKCRGKTAYWVDSAKKIGLVDCTSRTGGIRFDISEMHTITDPSIQVEEPDSANHDSSTMTVTTTPPSVDENSVPKTTVSTTTTIAATDKEKTMVSPRTGHVSTPLGASQGSRNMMPF